MFMMTRMALLANSATVASSAFGTLLGTLSVSADTIPNPAIATGSVVVAVGDLVCALLTQVSNLTVTAVTDNLGNTYTSEADLGIDAGTVTSKLFYARVTVAGTITSVSGTTTASGNNYNFLCAAFAGPFTAPPIDASPTAISSDITSPYTCPATGVLAQADELVIAFFGGQSSSIIPTATAPLAIAISSNTSAAGPIGVLAYQVVASTTSIVPEFVEATNDSTAVALGTASFKKA